MREIQIKNLFGRFDYSILLKKEGLTIITGPNGYGKSTILKIINALTKGFSSLFFFFELDFLLISIEFNDENKIVIEKKKNKLLFNKIEISEDFFKKNVIRELNRYPIYYRIGEDTWINRRTDEKFTLNDYLYKKYTESQDYNLENDIFKNDKENLYDLFEKIKKQIGNIYYINEQRLIKEIRNHRDVIEYKSTIDDLSEKLLERINQVQKNYSAISNKLDSTYPQRLFSNEDAISKAEFETKLESMTSKNEKLKQYRFVEESITTGLKFKDEYAKALKIYFDDFEAKYMVYEDLIAKLDLYTEIINARLTFKHIEISKEEGLVVKANNDINKSINLSKLSSGEKQEIVLFYDLIFGSDDKVLLLIDEPEISLHIIWQKTFMNDLIKVIKYKKIDVIVATHSPQIISNHWEQQVDLGELYDQQLNKN